MLLIIILVLWLLSEPQPQAMPSHLPGTVSTLPMEASCFRVPRPSWEWHRPWWQPIPCEVGWCTATGQGPWSALWGLAQPALGLTGARALSSLPRLPFPLVGISVHKFSGPRNEACLYPLELKLILTLYLITPDWQKIQLQPFLGFWAVCDGQVLGSPFLLSSPWSLGHIGWCQAPISPACTVLRLWGLRILVGGGPRVQVYTIIPLWGGEQVGAGREPSAAPGKQSQGMPRKSSLLLPLQGQLPGLTLENKGLDKVAPRHFYFPPSFNPPSFVVREIIHPRKESFPGRRTAKTISRSHCHLGPLPATTRPHSHFSQAGPELP